jgi:hypothetical protein
MSDTFLSRPCLDEGKQRSLYIACMPGMSASVDVKGSFFRPILRGLLKEMQVTAHFIRSCDPSIKQTKRFIERNGSVDLGRALLLVAKSFGGVRMLVDVIPHTKVQYGRVALLSIDPYGKGYSLHRKPIILPKWWYSDPYAKAVNFYQDNKGFRGAKVVGAANKKLSCFPDGEKVAHMNIVFHPAVKEAASGLVAWLLER